MIAKTIKNILSSWVCIKFLSFHRIIPTYKHALVSHFLKPSVDSKLTFIHQLISLLPSTAKFSNLSHLLSILHLPLTFHPTSSGLCLIISLKLLLSVSSTIILFPNAVNSTLSSFYLASLQHSTHFFLNVSYICDIIVS